MEDLTTAVEVFVSINLIALGLSYILQPDAWKALLSRVQSRGPSGSFGFAFLALGLGSFIVAFHNVWGGVATIVTVYGWGALVKGALYLLFPGFGLKRIAMALSMGAGLWRTAGALAMVLGVVVLRYALQA
ncbi:hypothetical protein [Candidatus Palauibacter sp.]|uniref:hypothetical protein n=1 Tax=Candidatus Palauibacter sp. TaxID=3101350 RepID=UPI003C6F4460